MLGRTHQYEVRHTNYFLGVLPFTQHTRMSFSMRCRHLTALAFAVGLSSRSKIEFGSLPLKDRLPPFLVGTAYQNEGYTRKILLMRSLLIEIQQNSTSSSFRDELHQGIPLWTLLVALTMPGPFFPPTYTMVDLVLRTAGYPITSTPQMSSFRACC